MDNLTELLEEQVKDLYSAENQLLKALPRMAKKASSEELKSGFLTHAEETKGHVERIIRACEILETKPGGKVCAAMKGLIEEGKEVLEEDGHDAVIDLALIAAAQRVEHYEMAAYGTVKAIATALDMQDLVDLFDETLEEEKATDEKLTATAEGIYPTAPKSEDDGQDDGQEEEDEEKEEGAEEDDDETPAARAKGKPGTRGAAGKTAAAAKGGKNSSGSRGAAAKSSSRR